MQIIILPHSCQEYQIKEFFNENNLKTLFQT